MTIQGYRSVMRLEPGDEKIMKLEERGIFFLHEEVNEVAAFSMAMNLLYLREIGFNGPVWIVMNSPGGEVAQGFAIYDAIRAMVKSGMPVNILAMGLVASMATAILQSASRRYSLPNTQFLIHQVSQTIWKTEEATEGRERVEETERINRIVMGMIAERSGMEIEKLIGLCQKKDYWLSAQTALESFGGNGLIDEITPDFSIIVRGS